MIHDCRTITIAGLALALTIATATAEPQGKTARGYFDDIAKVITAIEAREDLVRLIAEHNHAISTVGQDEIAARDKKWIAGDKAIIDPVVGNALSRFLSETIGVTKGRISEIIVMDRKGVAVGVSPKTSDLWQGDEAKWIKTYGAGPTAVHLGKVAFDESTKKWQSQISQTLRLRGQPVGAITVGFDVAYRGN